MRKKRAGSRIRIPDPRYNDVLVSEFINNIMTAGKKHQARRILYDAFDIIEERTKQPGLDVFRKAMSNARPVLEVKARRVGGATYQVPIEIRVERRQTLGLRWLVSFARKRGERTISARLAGEIMDGANSQGNAFKKKEDTHKMAEANKAFAHYRW